MMLFLLVWTLVAVIPAASFPVTEEYIPETTASPGYDETPPPDVFTDETPPPDVFTDGTPPPDAFTDETPPPVVFTDETPPPDGGLYPAFSCPDGWTMHSSQCLRYNPQNMTWEEAKSHCQSLQGALASVCDDSAAGELHQELTQAGHEAGPVWVGGYRSSENPSWSWSDASAPTLFGEFCGGDSALQGDDCLQISFDEHESGCLDAMRCDMELPSVCGIILM